MNLSRLLAGESAHGWGDFDPLSGSATGGSYRPWELMDLHAQHAAAVSSGALAPSASTVTAASSLSRLMAAGPPNVLAPPTSMATTRPQLHHSFYQPPPHHYIEQRGLPSFQSSFQEPFGGNPGGQPPPPHHHAPHPAHYPIVPAPVQARELPNIHQQFLDERHIHSQPGGAVAAGSYHQLQPRGVPSYLQPPPRVMRKSEPVLQRPPPTSNTIIEQHPTLTAQLRKKTNRAGSMDIASSVVATGGDNDHPPDTPGQVAAISSTDTPGGSSAGHPGSGAGAGGFKSPGTGSSPGSLVRKDRGSFV
jgi:hypothetical protein